eukprot:9649132-Ditylum_brightwellii.AAC.1
MCTKLLNQNDTGILQGAYGNTLGPPWAYPHINILPHACRCKLCPANKTSSPSAATICFKYSSG